MSGIPRPQSGVDPYRTLGVAYDASDADITRAYRRLLRQHHPDTALGHTTLDARRLADILAAYHQIRHDRRTSTSRSAGSTAVPITVHHHYGHREPRPSSQGDVRLGDQARDNRDHSNNSQAGRRRITISHRGTDTTAAVTITPRQAAAGAVVTVAAPTDPPAGRLRNIQVRIPAGTYNGQTLRIRGHGGPGHGDGPAGDLHLTIYHTPGGMP